MQIEPRTTGRLPNLDVLRGLAAMAVLVSHAYGLGGRKVPLAAGNLTDALLMLTPIGVWLFFSMSGLVIGAPFVRSLVEGRDAPRWQGYAVRRIARVYPLYLVCAGAVLLVVGRDAAMGPKTTAAHLLLLHNLLPGRQLGFINVTWTLTLEVLFYASIPIFAWAVRRTHRKAVTPGRLATLICWSAGASVGWMLAGCALAASAPEGSLWIRLLLPAMWSAFCPGLLIAVLLHATPADLESSAVLRILDRLRRDATAAWFVGGGAAAVGFASFFAQPDAGVRTYLAVYDLGRVSWSVAFGVLVLRAIDAHRIADRTPQPLEALGNWSYGVYLIHGTVFTIWISSRWSDSIPLAHGGLAPFVVHVVVLAGITLPLSWLSWRFVEQPAMEAGRRVTGRLATAPAT